MHAQVLKSWGFFLCSGGPTVAAEWRKYTASVFRGSSGNSLNRKATLCMSLSAPAGETDVKSSWWLKRYMTLEVVSSGTLEWRWDLQYHLEAIVFTSLEYSCVGELFWARSRCLFLLWGLADGGTTTRSSRATFKWRIFKSNFCVYARVVLCVSSAAENAGLSGFVIVKRSPLPLLKHLCLYVQLHVHTVEAA